MPLGFSCSSDHTCNKSAFPSCFRNILHEAFSKGSGSWILLWAGRHPTSSFPGQPLMLQMTEDAAGDLSFMAPRTVPPVHHYVPIACLTAWQLEAMVDFCSGHKRACLLSRAGHLPSSPLPSSQITDYICLPCLAHWPTFLYILKVPHFLLGPPCSF